MKHVGCSSGLTAESTCVVLGGVVLCSGCISEAVLHNVWIAGRVSSPPPNSLKMTVPPQSTPWIKQTCFLKRFAAWMGDPVLPFLKFTILSLQACIIITSSYALLTPIPFLYSVIHPSIYLWFSFLFCHFINILWRIISHSPKRSVTVSLTNH